VKLYRIKDSTLAGLTLCEEPRLEPGEGEALVKVHAVSLNFKDLNFLDPRAAALRGRVPLSDAAGEIVAVGPGVDQFQVGDRVVNTSVSGWISGAIPRDSASRAAGVGIDGVLTEYRVFDQEALLHLPRRFEYIEGATLTIAAVSAWNSLLELEPGQTLLVLGSGGVATFALQFGKARGTRVIMTTSSDQKIARLQELGADETIDRRQNPQWEKEVRRLTNGRGVDVVVDTVGGESVQQSVMALAFGGVVTVVGNRKGNVDAYQIMFRAARVRGIRVGSRDLFQKMLDFMAQRDIHPVIDRVFAFSEAARAYEYLQSAKHVGKIVIQVA
jgi:NADPH:quinone reductase-like Zn-dependent oxidoreductase